MSRHRAQPQFGLAVRLPKTPPRHRRAPRRAAFMITRADYGVQVAGPSPDETQHRPFTQHVNELFALVDDSPPTFVD
jgi:hypothetical protein